MDRKSWNCTKKSFLILLRIVFILSFLQFIKEAFYSWDGYSYYMRFIDFLPDLSLAFILWTIPGLILAFAVWLILYVLLKISQIFLKSIRLEHLMVWFIVIFLIFFIKKAFFKHISLSDLIGLSDFTILITGCVLVAIVVWFVRKYSEKILYELDTSITPVVWIFVFLLILAVPFSISVFKRGATEAKYIPGNGAHVTSLDKKRPNIILVTMDALSARDMQVYGYHRPTTPFISEWAKDAIVFKRAYSVSNWTTPGAMSLMTGQRVWTHRVWYFAIYSPVKGYTNNLPKILRNNGYNVYGFVQNKYAHPDILGIGESFLKKDHTSTFSKVFSNKSGIIINLSMFFAKKPIIRGLIKSYPFIHIENNVRTFLQIKNNIKTLLQRRKSLQKKKFLQNSDDVSDNIILLKNPPEIVYNSFLSYISSSTQKANEGEVKEPFKEPFFVWLYTWSPHDPYLPPKPYMGMFGDTEKFTFLRNGTVMGVYKPEDQGVVDVLRKRYDEFILYCDEQFRLFINRLSKSIDISNTIIILSSDHGENFSHGYQGHSLNYLYEPVVHIPLIIKPTGHKTGRIIDMPVEQTDIAPTILELAGIPVPKWMDGRSLVPLIKGEPMDPRPIFATHLMSNRSFGHPITNGTIAVWEGDYKLIHYLLGDKKSLLFNLMSDPDETQNIFKEKPKIAERLTKLIEDNLSRANKRIIQSHVK